MIYYLIMFDAQELAERIRERRKSLGLTQTDLALRANTSTPTIARIEMSGVGTVAFETVMCVLNSLNYNIYIEEGLSVPEASYDAIDVEQYLNERYFNTTDEQS